MSDRYTPDTIDVKVAYCSAFDPGFAHKVMSVHAAEMTTGHAGDFDRWLEKHDREVRARVLGDVEMALDAPDPDDHEHDDSVYLEWANNRIDDIRAIIDAATEETT